MRKSFSKYLYVRMYLKEANLLAGNFINYGLCFLLSLLIFSGPIAIGINLLIFNDTMKLLLAGIGLLAGLVIVLSKILFHKLVIKEKVDGIYWYYLYDGLFMVTLTILWSLLLV